MDESSADRFRRLQRSLDETGDWDEEDEEAASADGESPPGSEASEAHGEESFSGQEPAGAQPAQPGGAAEPDSEGLPIPGWDESQPGAEPAESDKSLAAKKAGEEPGAEPQLNEEPPLKEPARTPRIPQWRARRRTSPTGPLPAGRSSPTSGPAAQQTNPRPRRPVLPDRA